MQCQKRSVRGNRKPNFARALVDFTTALEQYTEATRMLNRGIQTQLECVGSVLNSTGSVVKAINGASA